MINIYPYHHIEKFANNLRKQEIHVLSFCQIFGNTRKIVHEAISPTKMSPLLNAILCSAEEIQEKQTSSSSCNDFALYDKFNLQPKNLAYFKFFWRKAYSKFLSFKSKNSNPFKFLGGCLKFKFIWKTTYDNVKDVKANLMWIA